MRLDLHTDYGLRTLIYLAGKPGRASAGEVAAFFRISRDHVAKVVQSLVRLGYVRSRRGVGGGVELAQLPDEIRVGQVILDFERDLHLLDCVGTANLCTIQPGCKLRLVLARAEQVQLEYLNSVRLSDIVRPGGQLLEITGPEQNMGQEAGVRGHDLEATVQESGSRGRQARGKRRTK
jgi:Rrf2 family transcriptional regulator, nitric oxide-sensitive transcriptional repressor